VEVEGGVAKNFAANFRSSAMTQTHEPIHGAGVENEATTEELAQYIQKKKLYSKTAEIGQEAAALEKSGQSVTTDGVMAQIKAKYGSDERVNSAIQKESEAQVEPAGEEKQKEEKQKVVAEIPEMGDLIRAMNDLKSGRGPDVPLNLGKGTLNSQEMRQFNILIQTLNNINKSVRDLGAGGGALGNNIKELSRRPEKNSTPLEIKVVAEAIEKSIS